MLANTAPQRVNELGHPLLEKLMQEIWKKVRGYRGRYEVSDQGGVRSFVKGRWGLRKEPKPLVPVSNGNGYLMVSLSKGAGVLRMHTVHSLVLHAFKGRRTPGKQVGHLNGKCHDNRLTNLKWVSAKENEAHKYAQGTRGPGELSPCVKLTNAEVLEIRAAVAAGTTQRSLALKYGVTFSNISCIVLRKSWGHL